MDVSRIRALRGPNLWSRHTAIQAIVAGSGVADAAGMACCRQIATCPAGRKLAGTGGLHYFRQQQRDWRLVWRRLVLDLRVSLSGVFPARPAYRLGGGGKTRQPVTRQLTISISHDRPYGWWLAPLHIAKAGTKTQQAPIRQAPREAITVSE